MYALPPRLDQAGEPGVTGVSCPDCNGVLSVHAEGKRGDLVFECRVGHTYTVDELLVAKEERLDDRLWTAYTALVEIVALLEDLDGRATSEGGRPRYRERRERARALAADLRRLVGDNRPVALPGGGGPQAECEP